MDSILELNGINNKRTAVDSRIVFAISEMEEETIIDKYNKTIYIPEYLAIFTDKTVFKVSNSYDEVINAIKELNYKNNLGL